MTAALFASLAVQTASMLPFSAVYACANSVPDFVASQVPFGEKAHLMPAAPIVSVAPLRKNAALPSVGSPDMQTTFAVFGSLPLALRPSTIILHSRLPT